MMDTAEATVLDVRRLAGRANPAPPSSLRGAAAQPQAQRLLREIVSGDRVAAAHHLRGGLTPPVPLARRGPARRLVLLGAAVAAVAAVGLGAEETLRGEPAAAALPPVLPYAFAAGQPAAAVLLQIAAAAAAQSTVPTGAYAYVRSAGWDLNTAVADGRTTSSLDSRQSESWTAADGSGLVLRRRGPSMVQRVGSRETYDALLGSTGSAAERVVIDEEGGYTLFPPFDLQALPWGDPALFARTVNRHETTAIPVAVDTVNAVTSLFFGQVLQPSDRSRVWRLLASLPEVTHRGPLQDRLGRAGEAFTVDDDGGATGLPLQLLLIVDATTGELLESDSVLTTDAGFLNVPVPSVSGIGVLISSGDVAVLEQRPAGAGS